MMSREQLLLTCLAEECAEVAQACSKAIRFGMEASHPDYDYTNRQKLRHELGDLLGVCDMLDLTPSPSARGNKPIKVEQFLAVSARLGQVEETPHD